MEQYKQLLDDGKSYLKTRYDLLRLELLDKLSKIFGQLVLIIVMLFLAMAMVAYLSVALVNALAGVMPVWLACVILAAIFIIAAAILFYNREKIFINPFVKLLSGLLFEEPQPNENEENGSNQTNVSDK